MRFFLASIFVGITSGLAGMSLALLLRFIQHLAYEYHFGIFLMGVEAASSERRVLVLITCGFVAGLGWWLLHRFGKPLIKLSDAIEQKPMPVASTLTHVLLQITTVAMGSPLGRESAPRELSALIAQQISSKINLSLEETKILVACGAAAGLAAVYNIPLAGAVFALEVLLRQFSVTLLLRSIIISGIAVAVSWIGLGNHPAYQVPDLSISFSLVVWSMIAGPILGFLGHYFIQAASYARSKAQTNWQTPVLCLIDFTLLGFLAIYFPALLGNGKSAAGLEFDSSIGFSLTACLLFLRILMTCFTLRAGAYGGLLTPSLANGALLGVLLGILWNQIWPSNIHTGSLAIIGATAFLASAQKMPITAVILIFEFTRVGPSFLLPILLAVLSPYVFGWTAVQKH